MTSWPDHGPLLDKSYGAGVVQALIERAHWQNAASVQAVAPHSYVVRGWHKDSLTEAEFDLLVAVVKLHGRQETWRAPEHFYDSGKRPTFVNTYLYLPTGDDLFAYWFTRSKSAAMLNRESTDIQAITPTRHPIESERLF